MLARRTGLRPAQTRISGLDFGQDIVDNIGVGNARRADQFVNIGGDGDNTPAINAVAPQLPTASKRAIEALDEVVVTLKAMQRSWMMRGNVKEVRELEKRKPANQ